MEKVNQYLHQIAKVQKENPIGAVIATEKELSDIIKTIDISFESLAYTEEAKNKFLRTLAVHIEDQKSFVFITLEGLPTPHFINYAQQLRDHSLTDFALGKNTLGTVQNKETSLILWLNADQFSALPNDLFGSVCNLTYQI
jgi:HD-GYP domain-containing protein (c-di-GMP phosphodiesterase class II)